jgi:hypothetical protein
MMSPSRIVSVAVAAVLSLSLPMVSSFLGRSHVVGIENDQTRQICTTELEMKATDGILTREAFASLVEILSQGEVQGPYNQLPLRYTATFNMHACLNGKDCIGDRATISVSTHEERMMTCATLESSLNQTIKTKECCETFAGNDTAKTCDASYPVDLKMGLLSVGK